MNKQSKTFETIPTLVVFLGVLYIFAFFASVALQCGLRGDDLYNINAPAVEYYGISIKELTIDLLKSWISMGRLFPTAFYTYQLFDLIPSITAYKFCICAAIALNCILVYILVRQYLDKEYALCSIILFPVFCNMSATYHSAIYSFHMLIQNNFTLILLSLIFIQFYFDKRKKRYMVFSCIVYAIALLMYEVAYPFVLVHVFICFINSKKIKSRIVNSIPLVSVWCAGIISNIIVRYNATAEKYTSIGFDIQKIFTAFINQLSASFPIIRYIIEAPKYDLPTNISSFFRMITVTDILIISICSAIIILITLGIKSKKSNVDFQKSVIGIILGLCLAIFPAALIALSSKYQSELVFGVGYLPTYISSFGVAICVAIIWINFEKKIMKVSEKLGILLSIVFCLIVSVFIALNLFLGRATVIDGKSLDFERELICDSAEFGLYDVVSSDDLLVGTTYTIFDAGDPPLFYSNINNRKIQAVYLSALSEIKKGEDYSYSYVKINYSGDVYATYHASDSNGNGIVLIAPMSYTNEDVCVCQGPVYCYVKHSQMSSFDAINILKINDPNFDDYTYTVLKQNDTEALILIEAGDCEYVLNSFSFINEIYSFNGAGTLEDPFTINNEEELSWLSNNVNNGIEYENCYFIQTENLDFEGLGEWCPIGEFYGKYSFKGIYNGDGHTISNLNTAGNGNNGLFGKLSGVVCNLGIESGKISGECVGSIASHSFGDKAMIINCYNKADIHGIRSGGIADNFTGGKIICCMNFGNVQCIEEGLQGGITSYTADTIWGSYSNTELTNEIFNGQMIDSEIKMEFSLSYLNEKLEQAKNEFELENIPIKYWE